VLCFIDDHSRLAISVTAHHRVTGPTVVDTFNAAIAVHGIPASTLTDNGMVFTARFAGGRGGRNGFETILGSLGVQQKNSRPNHPTTCGKVERFHQTEAPGSRDCSGRQVRVGLVGEHPCRSGAWPAWPDPAHRDLIEQRHQLRVVACLAGRDDQ
jgi:hypothetical protein